MGEIEEVLNFCKIDANLDSNPKIRKAGRDGRDVFEFVVRRNSLMQLSGAIPLKYIEPWYLADVLMMPEDDARHGVSRAVTASLLEIDTTAGVVRIVGWTPDWGRRPMTDAERQAKRREVKKGAKFNNHTPLVTGNRDASRKVTEVTDQRRGEEIRSEEIPEDPVPPKVGTTVTEPLTQKPQEKRARPPRELPQEARECAARLLARILANNPAHKLAGASDADREVTIERWADDFRKLHVIDHRPWLEIRSVLEWCQSDSFWAPNILSGATLREKWNQLSVKAFKAAPALNVRVGRVEPGTLDAKLEAQAKALENDFERDCRLDRERQAREDAARAAEGTA